MSEPPTVVQNEHPLPRRPLQLWALAALIAVEALALIVVVGVLAALGFGGAASQPVQHEYLAGGLALLVHNQPVAQFGAVAASVLKRLDEIGRAHV